MNRRQFTLALPAVAAALAATSLPAMAQQLPLNDLARFEYAAPDRTLVLASAGQLAIFDAKSNTGPEQYPLARTPLNLILAQNVDLARNGMVIAHRFDGTATIVTAQDPEHPEYGNIQLMFTANPIQLRQWVITDDTGAQTTTVLGELRQSGNLPDRQFSIGVEKDRRNL